MGRARRAAGDTDKGKLAWNGKHHGKLPLCGALSGHQGSGPHEPKPLEQLGPVVGKKRPAGSAQLHGSTMPWAGAELDREVFPKKLLPGGSGEQHEHSWC